MKRIVPTLIIISIIVLVFLYNHVYEKYVMRKGGGCALIVIDSFLFNDRSTDKYTLSRIGDLMFKCQNPCKIKSDWIKDIFRHPIPFGSKIQAKDLIKNGDFNQVAEGGFLNRQVNNSALHCPAYQLITETQKKTIFITGIITCYILVLISITYAQQKAKLLNNLSYSKLKEEVRYNTILRGLMSIPVYFCLVDWIASLNLASWSYFHLPEWVQWSGLIILLLDTLFFWWIHICLAENYHGPLYLHDKHRLVTSGPYKLMRHPTYLAFPLLFIGLSLSISNWLIVSLALPVLFVVNIRRIKVEEKLLIKRFGDEYIDYMKKTGWFFPKILAD